MITPETTALDRVRRYLEAFPSPPPMARRVDEHDGATLFLGDLIDVVWLASEGVR